MSLARITCLVATLACSAAVAEPIAQMGGSWRGSGWARETPEGPQETVRCQITNSYDAEALTLTLSGQCVVPGRRLTMSGTLTGTDGAEEVSGRWSNPDGAGSARIFGIQRDDLVAFTFNATDQATGRDLAQNIEWRVSGDALHLRSTDRDDPSIMMSDITFGR